MTTILNDLGKDDLLSSLGLARLWEHLEESGESDFAKVLTNTETGSTRVLMIRGTQDTADPNKFGVKFKYLYNHDSNKNEVVDFMHIRGKKTESGAPEISSVKVLGHKLDLSDNHNALGFMAAVRELSDAVIRDNAWVNPVKVLDQSGIMPSVRGRKSWPGLFVSGDLHIKAVAVSTQEQESKNHYEGPVFPVLFFHSIVGTGPDKYAKTREGHHSLSLGVGENGSRQNHICKYTYRNKGAEQNLEIEGIVSALSAAGFEEETFYKLKTGAAKKPKGDLQIKHLEFLGRNVDLSNSRDVATTLELIRHTNRMIRAGDRALLDNLKQSFQDRRLSLPSESILNAGDAVYDVLNSGVKASKASFMTYQSLGGSNTTKVVSDVDASIGANTSIIGMVSRDDAGEYHRKYAIVDAGVAFHDQYDVTFYNFEPYLADAAFIHCTHKHQDHIGALPFYFDAGYAHDIPLIMEPMTQRQVDRDMQELGLDKNHRERIARNTIVIDLKRDVNPQNPEQRIVREVAGKRVEQWTQVIEGEGFSERHYYPRLNIDGVDVYLGPMPHSAPGLMIGVEHDGQKVLITGDVNLNDEKMLGLPELRPWLKGNNWDLACGDSTGATKEGRNPTEADVAASIRKLMESAPDKCHVFVGMGSNLPRLKSVIQETAHAGKSALVIDGKAVEDLVNDANKVEDIKKEAKRVYGIDIITRSQKKAYESYVADPSRKGEYAMYVSGTQGETYSTLKRGIQDWLPSNRFHFTRDHQINIVQGVIPCGRNKFQRMEIKDIAERFYGMDVRMPEEVAEEAERLLHSSGHGNRDDLEEIWRTASPACVIPIHGGPDQLEAHKDIVRGLNIPTMTITGSQSVKIEKGKTPELFEVLPSELIGIKVNAPPDKFFLKRDYSTTIIPVRPKIDGAAAKLLNGFEYAARSLSGVDNKLEAAQAAYLPLSRAFNTSRNYGALSRGQPFGIERYKSARGGKPDVFADKNIHAIGCFDTETGGLNSRQHLISQFGMIVESVDGRSLAEFELQQRIPDYRMPSAKAMLVTNTFPEELDEGLPAHEFSYEMDKALKSIKDFSHQVANERLGDDEPTLGKNGVKALSVAHNARFDNRMIAQEKARNLDTNVRPQMRSGTINVCTRRISRILRAYAAKDYPVAKNEDTGFDDHTLESLCGALGIKYPKNAHNALADTRPALQLFRKQYEIAPELVGQAILNADKSSKHLIRDLQGKNYGFKAPHPIVSYVSPSATRPEPQMGCYVGMLDTNQYVVLFNLKYDPEEYLKKSPDEIVALITDRDSDVFEVFDLDDTPEIVPARYGMAARANKMLSKQTLDRRAAMIKENLNHVDPQYGFQTISQKIDAAWQESRERIFSARILRNYPDLQDPPRVGELRFEAPEDGGLQLRRMQAQMGFNPIYRAVVNASKDYLNALREGDDAAKSEAYAQVIHVIGKGGVKLQSELLPVQNLINNIHYDINADDLTEAAQEQVLNMRKCIGAENYRVLAQDLRSLVPGSEDFDPAEFDRYVGTSRKKKQNLVAIEDMAAANADYAELDHGAMGHVRPWRAYTIDHDGEQSDGYSGFEPAI